MLFSRPLYGVTSILGGALLVSAQSPGDDGYVGYKLQQRGDPLDVTYDTASTSSNVSLTNPVPDVFLNASVHVGEISVLVQNLTAKINLDAQVLELLQFNAGVDAHVDEVSLLIQNITARVTLEARLGNVVRMVNSVLDSLDLNPILATLGQGIGDVVGEVGDVFGDIGGGGSTGGTSNSTAAISKRSFELSNGILYAINDYEGNTHTNRVLEQNGDIANESLDNNGRVSRKEVVGNYLTDMRFNGYDEPVTRNGKEVRQREYVYEPFPGLIAICAIFKDGDAVVGTQLLAEASGGGSSVIEGQD